MQLTMRRWTYPRSLTYIVVVLVLALLLALSAFLVVGSLHRLPGPFGLAKPGLIAYDDGGHIFAKNVDGTAVTQITTGATFDFSPAWSADGSSLVYLSATSRAADDPSVTASLMYLPEIGADPKVIAGGMPVNVFGMPPVLSPDGNFVALVRDVNDVTSIAVLSVASGELLKTIPNADQPA